MGGEGKRGMGRPLQSPYGCVLRASKLFIGEIGGALYLRRVARGGGTWH